MKNKLKEFREALGLTQEQLGKLVGTSFWRKSRAQQSRGVI